MIEKFAFLFKNRFRRSCNYV